MACYGTVGADRRRRRLLPAPYSDSPFAMHEPLLPRCRPSRPPLRRSASGSSSRAHAAGRAALAIGALSLASACAAVLGFDDTSVVDALEAGPGAPTGDGGPSAVPDATLPPADSSPTPDAARDATVPDATAPDGATDASVDAPSPSDAGAPHPGCLRTSVDSPTTAIQPVRDEGDVRFVVTDAVMQLPAVRLEICTPANRTPISLTLKAVTENAPYTYESPEITLPAGTSQVVVLTGQIFPAVRETLFYAR